MMRNLPPQQREKPTEFYLESVVTLGVLEVRLQAARQRQQSIQVTLRALYEAQKRVNAADEEIDSYDALQLAIDDAEASLREATANAETCQELLDDAVLRPKCQLLANQRSQ